MTDPVWPLDPDDVPEWKTVNGFGTALMRNTRPDAQGRCFATEWFMWGLPIFPVNRYWVREGKRTAYWPETRHFEVFGQSRIRPIETLKTYLCCWGLLPVLVTPWHYRDVLPWGFAEVPNELGFLLFSACLAAVYLAVWALYGRFLRPVREAEPVPTAPPREPRFVDPDDKDMWS